jgi:hypothetical protein
VDLHWLKEQEDRVIASKSKGFIMPRELVDVLPLLAASAAIIAGMLLGMRFASKLNTVSIIVFVVLLGLTLGWGAQANAWLIAKLVATGLPFVASAMIGTAALSFFAGFSLSVLLKGRKTK